MVPLAFFPLSVRTSARKEFRSAEVSNRDNREPRQRTAVAGNRGHGGKCVQRFVTSVSVHMSSPLTKTGRQTRSLPVGGTVPSTGGRYWDPARDDDSP